MNCIFINNTAGDAGGAINTDYYVADIFNCTFNNNSAANWGANMAFHNRGGTCTTRPQYVSIINCIIYYNDTKCPTSSIFLSNIYNNNHIVLCKNCSFIADSQLDNTKYHIGFATCDENIYKITFDGPNYMSGQAKLSSCTISGVPDVLPTPPPPTPAFTPVQVVDDQSSANAACIHSHCYYCSQFPIPHDSDTSNSDSINSLHILQNDYSDSASKLIVFIFFALCTFVLYRKLSKSYKCYVPQVQCEFNRWVGRGCYFYLVCFGWEY